MNFPKYISDWIEQIEKTVDIKPQSLKYAFYLAILDDIKNSKYTAKTGKIELRSFFMIAKYYWKPLYEYGFDQTDDYELTDEIFCYIYKFFSQCHNPKSEDYTFGHFAYVNDAAFREFIELPQEIIMKCFFKSGLITSTNLWTLNKSSLVFDLSNVSLLKIYCNFLQKLIYYRWSQYLFTVNKMGNKNNDTFENEYQTFKNNIYSNYFLNKKIAHHNFNEISTVDDIYSLISSNKIYKEYKRTLKFDNIMTNAISKNESVYRNEVAGQVKDNAINKNQETINDNNDIKIETKNNVQKQILDNINNDYLSCEKQSSLVEDNSHLNKLDNRNFYIRTNEDGNIVYSNYKFLYDTDSSVDNKVDEYFVKIKYESSSNLNESSSIFISSDLFSMDFINNILKDIPIKKRNISSSKILITDTVSDLNCDYDNYLKYKNSIKDILNLRKEPIFVRIFGEDDCLCSVYDYFSQIFSLFTDIHEKIILKLKIDNILNTLNENSLKILLMNLFENNYDIINQLVVYNIKTVLNLKYINILDFSLLQLKIIFNRLNWLSVNEPNKVIDYILRTLEPVEMYVIKERYFQYVKNPTLEDIGNKVKLSRERIRQIEAKALKKLGQRSRAKYLKNIYNYIYLFKENDYFIPFCLIEDLNLEKVIKFSNYVLGISFITYADIIKTDDNLIKEKLSKFILNSYFSEYKFDIDYDDSRVLKEDGLSDNSSEISNYILFKLPNFIDVQDLNKLTCEMKDFLNLKINDSDLRLLIKANYYEYGQLLSKEKLSDGDIIKRIVLKYFSKGIFIYDSFELDKLRKLVEKEYNIVLNCNDHALSSRIQRECLIMDKGKYFVTDKKIMSGKLAHKIYSFMVKENQNTYFEAQLFSIFEEELKNENINNRFLMKSALRQYYNDTLVFFKDYISLSKQRITIVEQIILFIKNKKRVVNFDEIKTHFKGVEDHIINIAAANSSILNYYSKYLHIDNLKIENSDIQFLHEQLSTFVNDCDIHHINDFFEYINVLNHQLLLKLNIQDYFSLFSVLERYLGSIFAFKRPFVAKLGVSIENQKERLKQFIEKYEEITIQKVLSYARENNLRLYSILQLVDELENYVLKDANTIKLLSKTRLNKYNYDLFEKVLDKEIGNKEFIIANKLKSYSLFPNEVNWTPWLIYSAINKFSLKYKAIPTNNRFRQQSVVLAQPLIIKKSIQVDDIYEFMVYIKSKMNMNDENLYKFLNQEGLV